MVVFKYYYSPLLYNGIYILEYIIILEYIYLYKGIIIYIIMKIKRKLIKIGDSLGVTIEKGVCDMLNLKKGNYVEFQNLKKSYKLKGGVKK